MPVEAKNKSRGSKSQNKEVAKTSSMALRGRDSLTLLTFFFQKKCMGRTSTVEDEGEGDNVEHHVVHKVPEKVAQLQ